LTPPTSNTAPAVTGNIDKEQHQMTDMTKDDEATCHAVLLAVGEMVEGRNPIEVISGAISALAKMAAHSLSADEPPKRVRDFAQKVGSLVASAIVYVASRDSDVDGAWNESEHDL